MKFDPSGNWRIYAPTIPGDAEVLGTITRAPGDTGALIRYTKTGLYAQLNAGVIRTLDGRSVAAAMGHAGRPTLMHDGRNVNVYLDEASIDAAKALGGGSISAGIRKSFRSHK